MLISSSSNTLRTSNMYFELNPISILSPSFLTINSSLTEPSSDLEFIVNRFPPIVHLIKLFFPSLAIREALSIDCIRNFLSTFILVLQSLGKISLYFMNSPSISLMETFVLSKSIKASLEPIINSTSSSISDSDNNFNTSESVFA